MMYYGVLLCIMRMYYDVLLRCINNKKSTIYLLEQTIFKQTIRTLSSGTEKMERNDGKEEKRKRGRIGGKTRGLSTLNLCDL